MISKKIFDNYKVEYISAFALSNNNLNRTKTLIDILSGVRSACTYVGAKKLKSLSKCATFVRVNNTHNTIYGV